MTESFRFFDAATYSESEFSEVLNRIIGSGVVRGATANDLGVVATGAMGVRVLPGEAFVQGFYYKNDANLDIAVPQQTSGALKIGRIVLHLDRGANSIHAILIQGAPGAGVPSLTRTTTVWEISLAKVNIQTGAIQINASDITDERADQNVGGYAIATGTSLSFARFLLLGGS